MVENLPGWPWFDHADPVVELDARTRRRGTELCYAVYGDPDGDPVLFCHATPGSRVEGLFLAKPAASLGVKLVVPDRPGYGYSGPTAGSIVDRSLWAAGVVDELGVDRFGVVGFSGGGPYALSVAESYPDRVTGVAVVSCPPPRDGADAIPWVVHGDSPRPVGESRESPVTVTDVLREVFGGSDRDQRTETTDRRRGIQDFSRAELVERYGGVDDPGTSVDPGEVLGADLLEAVRRSTDAAERERELLADDWGVALGDLEPPVALLYGGADRFADPDAVDAFADRLPAPALGRVPGESHLSTLLAVREATMRYVVEDLTLENPPRGT